jgi:hypothetical protein
MYTSSEKELQTRAGRYREWLEGSGYEKLKAYGFQSIHSRGLGPNQEIEFLSTKDADPIRVLYPKAPGTLVPKGLLLRLEIMAAVDWIDEAGSALERQNAYFVVVDGSGAFHFDNMFHLVDGLLNRPWPEVVLGQRPQANVGMAPWRRAIELFEEFVLLQKRANMYRELCVSHPNGLPDSQAGCWALRLSAVKSLPLTARSYEVEFDLLASALGGGVRCAFTQPLIMENRGESDFGAGEPTGDGVRPHIRKLYFIQYKLGLTTEELVGYLRKYIGLPKSDSSAPVLPRAYIDAVQRLDRGGDPSA